ncbi:gene transfer agent family protein [Hyphomicrobium sp. 2TAF46]|uniref:gene transfer agent family protein n=1 Tax=Hyphomicrobium sp. 2TAF46 TaxID=3233019 RepID=UPI003F912F0C
MPNKHRGEIEAMLDGRAYRLVLTLGALAELESAFGDDDMLALAARFEKGRLSARDCVKVIAAGLRGAGCAVTDDEVALMRASGGAAEYVGIVARLLNATFGGSDEASDEQPKQEAGGEARAPFAWRV